MIVYFCDQNGDERKDVFEGEISVLVENEILYVFKKNDWRAIAVYNKDVWLRVDMR